MVWLIIIGLAVLVLVMVIRDFYLTRLTDIYWVKLCATTQDGTEIKHILYVRAWDQKQARRKGVARASRRFKGCGIEVYNADRQ